jgi:hypothetical protein
MNIMRTNPFTLREIIEVADGKIRRLRVKEADSEGKYIDLERPLGAGDLKNLRKAAQAANLLARGISDREEIVSKVNASPASSNRRMPDKPPADQRLSSGPSTKGKRRLASAQRRLRRG